MCVFVPFTMLILIIAKARKNIFITFEAGCPRQMTSAFTIDAFTIRHAVFNICADYMSASRANFKATCPF